MSKNEQIDPYEIAKRANIIKRVFDPNAPLVRMDTVIVVLVHYGDGSKERPAGMKRFYYTKDGALIGESNE